LKFLHINLDLLNFKFLALKRIHTRSHPDPELVTIVDNPEKLIRKRNTTKGHERNNPLLRALSSKESCHNPGH
jgi:hypothetical protein